MEPMLTTVPNRSSRWPKALLAVAIATIVAINPSRLALVAVLFVAVVPFEKLFPRHRQRLRRPGLTTDLTYALAQPALAVATLAVGLAIGITSLAWVPGLLVRPAVASLPGPARTVAAVLLFDLAIYWVHRWSHEVPFLWRFHSIHHSSERMDWISAVRVHPLDGALLAPVLVFLLSAGFSPRLSGVLAIAQGVIGLFLHANVRWRWRPLHKVVITPEFHHWHHANVPEAYNSNFAGEFPWLDALFGTLYLPTGRMPARYGIDEEQPRGYLRQLAWPFRPGA
jgi:sterol desaturase/sphingolipid hydroxylase (fatty acid hydroxylase superfamily)